MGRSGRLGRFIHQGSIRSTTITLATRCLLDPALGGEPRVLQGAEETNACSPGEGRAARWQSRSLDGRRRERAEVPTTPWMTRITHRPDPSQSTTCEALGGNVRVHGPELGLGQPSGWVRGGGRTQGIPGARGPDPAPG